MNIDKSFDSVIKVQEKSKKEKIHKEEHHHSSEEHEKSYLHLYKEINEELNANSFGSDKTFRTLDGIYEHLEDITEHKGPTLDIWG